MMIRGHVSFTAGQDKQVGRTVTETRLTCLGIPEKRIEPSTRPLSP